MKPFLHCVPALLLLAGCTVGPEHRVPPTSVPATYSHRPPVGVEPDATAVSLEEWWSVFNDAQLTALIRGAAVSNLDVRIAQARVREARARWGSARSGLFPQLDSQAGYTRARLSENSSAGRLAAGAGQALEGDAIDAAFDMRWEVDVFGGTRRAVQSARAEVDARGEAVRGTRVIVLAEVGLTYLDLRSAQRQLEVARENLRTQQETLALTQDRFQAGLTSELDVSRARGQVSATGSQIPPLEESMHRAIHRLGVLLGKPPEALEQELVVAAPIPTMPPRIPVGLPSDLLRQRPDIRQSERELAAATAQVGVAVAEWFPKFYLTAAAGVQGVEAADLIDGGSRFWSIGPGIRWPIFNAGRIRQNIRIQDARQEQAALSYERTVLTALEETENALVAFGQEQERQRALAESVQAARRSVALADERYRGGLAAFLDVLEAQRTLLAAEDALVQADRRVGQNLVRVFKALGGGWQGQAETVAASLPSDARSSSPQL